MNSKLVVFEAIRKRKGGGTLLAVHEDFNPKLVEEYSDEFELIVVEITTEDQNIRIITGYGPQENWEEPKRLPFFIALETEVEKAELAGRSVIIEIDANSKLGPSYISGDPHDMTPNGCLLDGIIKRHNLTVGNGTSKCEGTITRSRRTRKGIEQSVIDFLMFSSDLTKHFVSMHIDEKRKHVLTRIRKTKQGIKVKESDHNVLLSKFKCKVKPSDKDVTEVYNLKSKECQAKFKKYTSETNMLSSSVTEEGDIDTVVNRFMKKLEGCIAINFKKVRVRDNKKQQDNTLYDKMRMLKDKDDPESKIELEKVKIEIAEAASKNFIKMKLELSKIKPGEGKIDSKQLWKLKKKLCPRSRDALSVMNDKNGNLISSEKASKERALEVYKERLQGNNIESHLEGLEKDTNLLCKIRVKTSQRNKTEAWTMDDLKEALKQLGNDKSRDPEGHINEIFKESVAGTDLLKATLRIMNLIKKTQKYPHILEKCNISSIHKKKSKRDFENYRGIFRVQILRSILDRLMYNDCYYTIDNNITDGNVGARKQRSVRDNIFVISAIINSVSSGSCPPIQVQVMDVEKCFDKLWLQACINALYEAGINHDHLNLLYIENKQAQIAVKINDKLSARIRVRDLGMQGSVWGSIQCTTLMDRLNKTAMSDKSLQYNYKQDPNIPIGI